MSNQSKNQIEQHEPQTGTAESTFEPITSQDQLDKLISGRIARERSKYGDYDALKQKAAKFDEIEQANKSELQRAQEAATAALFPAHAGVFPGSASLWRWLRSFPRARGGISVMRGCVKKCSGSQMLW